MTGASLLPRKSHRVLGHRDRRFAGVRQPIVRGISGCDTELWRRDLVPRRARKRLSETPKPCHQQLGSSTTSWPVDGRFRALGEGQTTSAAWLLTRTMKHPLTKRRFPAVRSLAESLVGYEALGA